jgi:hypothetical protein
VIAIFAVALASAPASSAATTRFVSPNGANSAACTDAAPCDFPKALTLTAASDTIVVKSGTYLANPGFTVAVPNVDIVGEDGTKPELKLTGVAPAGQGVVFGAGASGGKLRHLTLEALGGVSAVTALAPMTVSDVDVSATGPGVTVKPGVPGLPTIRRSRISVAPPSGGGEGLVLDAGTVVSDTLVRADSPAALPSSSAIVSAGSSRFRNVTAIASGTGSRGLLVKAGSSARTVSVKNSILRGDTAANDMVVFPGGPAPFSPGNPICMIDPAVCIDTVTSDVTIDHSNFRASSGPLNAASGSNQTADPQFTSAPSGDFRPKAGSPAIDAGIDDPDNGPTDLDGKARNLGLAPDMGAYEFVLPPPPPAQPTPSPTPPGGTGPQSDVVAPVADRTAPAMTALGVTNKKFAVARQATPVAARAKKGTTFVYTLSEPARVTLTIEKAVTGRRKGKKCVKVTHKNRKARKCKRYVKAGTLTRTGITGANAVPFSGRIGSKALKPATYRVRMVAVDSAGNKSTTKTVNFKIVKK